MPWRAFLCLKPYLGRPHAHSQLSNLASALTPQPCVSFRRGNEPSFGSAPRRVGGGRRVVEDASEEEGDSQGDFNGAKPTE